MDNRFFKCFKQEYFQAKIAFSSELSQLPSLNSQVRYNYP